MPEHTPTPWKLHVEPKQKYTPTLTGAQHYDEEYIAIVGADGPGDQDMGAEGVVADNAGYYARAITKEDAAFIVQAVNAHAALVAALTRTQKKHGLVIDEEVSRLNNEALKLAGAQ